MMHATLVQPNSSCETKPTILERVALGDREAFTQFIEQYGRLVGFLVRRSMRHDSADLDDAVQDMLMAIWQAAPRFDRTRGSEKTFIATIIRHRLIDLRRKASGRSPVGLLEGDPADQAMNPQDHDDDRGVSAVLARIDPAQRHLVELAVVHGKSHRQIATSTGLPLGTVKSSISRTLARLRSELLARQAAA